MKFDKFCECIKILQLCPKDSDGVGHVSKEDEEKLRDLGWFDKSIDEEKRPIMKKDPVYVKINIT